MRAIVVGGGIGGLASAAALLRGGWDVEVLERAAEFTEAGAGLSLWPNALRALDALGLGDQVRDRSVFEGQSGIRTARGRWLSKTDADAMNERFGPVVMVHRSGLLDVLLAAVPAGLRRGGISVTEVRPDGTVTHSAGNTTADLVVGADGLRSVTRRSLWPASQPPRYSGYTTWRLVTPPVPIHGICETWGNGERFGYSTLPDGRIYCYATANAAEGTVDGGLAELRERFGSWHEPIPALLEAADPDAVLRLDVYEVPPLRSYVKGNVALVGDAAHAMTPDLGQGGCQALEDAVVLGRVLTDCSGPAIAERLADYDQKRRPRTQMIARQSARIGIAAQWASPVAVGLRNTGLRLMPDSALARSLAPALDWAG
jgi:2-polyprenyl-6-methoxyphenol hydroxylase-like FAD-dependent oxidoreductase